MRQREGISPRPGSSGSGGGFRTAQVRRETYERYARSIEPGVPTWVMVFVWLLFAAGLFAFFLKHGALRFALTPDTPLLISAALIFLVGFLLGRFTAPRLRTGSVRAVFRRRPDPTYNPREFRRPRS